MTDLDKLVDLAMQEWNPQWRAAPRTTQENQWRAMRKVVKLIQNNLGAGNDSVGASNPSARNDPTFL